MKRLAILLILTGGAYQLKAQQAHATAADSLLKSINKYVKSQPDARSLLNQDLAFNETLALNDIKSNAVLNIGVFRSNMPVAVLEGNSKMPVVKLNGYDNMPGSGTDRNGPGILRQQEFQGLPAFKAPAALSPAPKK